MASPQFQATNLQWLLMWSVHADFTELLVGAGKSHKEGNEVCGIDHFFRKPNISNSFIYSMHGLHLPQCAQYFFIAKSKSGYEK